MTMKEMAAAYATVQNGGVYRTPLYYTKITDNSGNTVFEPKQEEVRVFSEQNAWLLLDLLKEPIYGAQGTGGSARISGQDVRGKTGTTNDNYDRWLCGFTPYYTAVTWYGFDKNETIEFGGKNPAGLIWANVMKSVHKDLERKNFERPDNIENATICPSSGKVANGNCQNTYTEYFLQGTMPETCTVH